MSAAHFALITDLQRRVTALEEANAAKDVKISALVFQIEQMKEKAEQPKSRRHA